MQQDWPEATASLVNPQPQYNLLRLCQTCLNLLYVLNGAPVHKMQWAAHTGGVGVPGWGVHQRCGKGQTWAALEGRQQRAAAGQLAGDPPGGQACLSRGGLSGRQGHPGSWTCSQEHSLSTGFFVLFKRLLIATKLWLGTNSSNELFSAGLSWVSLYPFTTTLITCDCVVVACGFAGRNFNTFLHVHMGPSRNAACIHR